MKPFTPKSEKAIELGIRREAKRLGYWTMKIAGGPYQLAGVPDLLCIRNGVAKWIEVKKPGGVLSPIQKARIAEIKGESGADVIVAYSVEQAREFLGKDREVLDAKAVRYVEQGAGEKHRH
jgi:hypothetical protein